MEELHHLRNELDAANSALEAQRSRCSSLTEEIRAVRQTAANRVATAEADAAQCQRGLNTAQAETAAMEEKITQHAALQKQERAGESDLEHRLTTLSEALVATQSQLEVAKTERAAYQNKVSGLTRRLQRATAAATDGDGFLVSNDLAVRFEDVGGVESGLGHGIHRSSSRGGGLGLQRRRSSNAPKKDPRNAISRVLPIKHAKTKKAIDAVDRATLQTALFVTRNPLARLILVMYVLFLHLWVFVVLTHGVTTVGDVSVHAPEALHFPVPMLSEHPITGEMLPQHAMKSAGMKKPKPKPSSVAAVDLTADVKLGDGAIDEGEAFEAYDGAGAAYDG